jgi:carotenoid cleavage dioxygenase-like enzyme
MLQGSKVELTLTNKDNNPFLQGPFAPNDTEFTVTGPDLKVISEIPKDLCGVYVRNTHNQVHEPIGIYHPFDGDSMMHAVHFFDGKVEYRNRFVRTTGFLAEQAAGKALWPGLLQPNLHQRRGWGSIGSMKDNAGTEVRHHNGQLLATMSQGGEPWRLDPITLETLGPDTNMSRRIKEGVSSHYKVDIDTGELMFFNYPEHPPFMNYGVVNAKGEVVHYVPIELPGARWPHDLGITKNYTVLHDLPLYFDPAKLKSGEHDLIFNRDMPARFGVVPRYGDNSTIRWFEATSCFVLHLANCYEDGDEVIMDACIMPDFKKIPVNQFDNAFDRIRANLDKHNNKTFMHRWRFNMRTGQTREERIDDEVTEFPTVSNEVVGKPYRYAYNVLYKKGDWLFSGLKRFDLERGTAVRYEYGDGRYGSEPQMARAVGATREDDGYVLTFVTDMNTNTSECLILRADDMAAGPVARVILPERIQVGTHACWVEADRLHGERVKAA